MLTEEPVKFLSLRGQVNRIEFSSSLNHNNSVAFIRIISIFAIFVLMTKHQDHL